MWDKHILTLGTHFLSHSWRKGSSVINLLLGRWVFPLLCTEVGVSLLWIVIIITTFIEYLLSTCVCIYSLNLYQSPVGQISLSCPFYRWGSSSTEKLSNLLRVIHWKQPPSFESGWPVFGALIFKCRAVSSLCCSLSHLPSSLCLPPSGIPLAGMPFSLP